MTLRVKIEIVPYGVEESAYEIHRFEIFNKGPDGIIGDHIYGVIEMGENGNGLHDVEIRHKRSYGAVELARQVLNKCLWL